MSGETKQAPVGSILRYIFIGLLFLTWIFWNVAIFHCSFFRYGAKSTNYKDMGSLGIFTEPLYESGTYEQDLSEVDIYGMDIYDMYDSHATTSISNDIYTCARYHPDAVKDFDAAANASRVFGAFGFIFHTLAFFMAIIVQVCLSHQRVQLVWLIIRILVIVSFVCSLLIFSAFGTEICTDDSYIIDAKCVPGPAGVIAIFNIVFILAALVLSWFVRAPENPILFIRRWQEGNGASKGQGHNNLEKEQPASSNADPTQNMNDETHNVEVEPEPPTLTYIQTETAAEDAPKAMALEAEA